MPSILVSIIHYQTPELLEEAARSFRAVYPSVDLLLVDNGSRDGSAERLREVAKDVGARAWMLAENVYHGPAMDRVLCTAEADAVFFLDSDTVTRRAGFLEAMADLVFEADDVLAAGRIVTVDRRGFAAPVGIPVPQSAFMMVRRDLYVDLPPFVHHGLPVLATCTAAHRRGLRMAEYAVDTYVDHLGRGTAERYGYGLGLRSRLDFLLHRMGL